MVKFKVRFELLLFVFVLLTFNSVLEVHRATIIPMH